MSVPVLYFILKYTVDIKMRYDSTRIGDVIVEVVGE